MKKAGWSAVFISFWACVFAAENKNQVSSLLKKADSPAAAEAQADSLLKLLTNEEKFSLAGGRGWKEMGIPGIPRLGIPPVRFADASAGVRIEREMAMKENSTAFPCPLLLAATWNPELSYAYARSIGEECRTLGIGVLLGPGVNLYRNSENGRNFEYMGEDPFLVSLMGAAYVRGLQGVDVTATIKHFLCNNSEFKRKGQNVVVDDRTLREIYTPAFKAAIDADVRALMGSYNLVNGEWTGQSKELIQDFLREELGFRGLVMTDWMSVWDGRKLAASGTDLEMPRGDALDSEKSALLGSPEIDRMARNVLKTFIANGFYEMETAGNFAKPEWIKKYPEHVEVAHRVNEEGIVLLKNNGILPMSPAKAGFVLVCGDRIYTRELSALGSGHVVGYDSKSYSEEALRRFGSENVRVVNVPTDDELRAAGTVLIFCGIREGEAMNRSFELPENRLIARSVSLNSNTVVCLITGGSVATDWADDAAGVLYAGYGGQTSADAMFDVLLGKVNPSGKLPFTFEKRIEDGVAFGEDKIQPNSEEYYSPLLPSREPDSFFCAEKPNTVYTYDLPYKEGIFTGYRWFDMKKIAPRFPFGHGLSYTSFRYSNMMLSEKDGRIVVRMLLKNAGGVPGAETVQVYVRDVQSSVPRPEQELKAFQKLVLKPGESKTVELELNAGAFRFWNPETRAWTVETGEFEIRAGSSSRDIRLTKTAGVSSAGGDEKAPLTLTQLIRIDEKYNLGSNVAEYQAIAGRRIYTDGVATTGGGDFEAGKAVGSNHVGINRPALFFKLPEGCLPEQIKKAELFLTVHALGEPAVDMDIYSLPQPSLGTRNTFTAWVMFNDPAFKDTGAGLSPDCGTGRKSFDVTKAVQDALAQNTPEKVAAFRFQIKSDTDASVVPFGSKNNYQILGFGARNEADRPCLVLTVSSGEKN